MLYLMVGRTGRSSRLSVTGQRFASLPIRVNTPSVCMRSSVSLLQGEGVLLRLGLLLLSTSGVGDLGLVCLLPCMPLLSVCHASHLYVCESGVQCGGTLLGEIPRYSHEEGCFAVFSIPCDLSCHFLDLSSHLFMLYL